MTLAERRIACIRLLARIDQQIREAESLMNDRRLSWAERRSAAACLSFRRQAMKSVERMLVELELSL
jgi:hypothetical protein